MALTLSTFLSLPAWFVWGAAAIVFGEAALIAALVVQLTRRRSAELALRDSEASATRAHAEMLISRQRYELATAACGVGVWDWDLQTLEFYIDPLFMVIIGHDEVPPNRFDGLLRFVHPQDREQTERLARACMEGRSTLYAAEHRMLCKDGSVRWFQCRGSAIADERGAPARVVGTFWDITERKSAEVALRESALALRARHEEIQDLAGRLIAAQEDERRRIARDLHDDLSQKLALLTIDLEHLSGSGAFADRANERVQGISKLAGEIATDVHQLSHELHPTKLEALGLVAAIQSVCRDITNQHRVEVEFEHEYVPARVPPDVALCLYRIVQESLRNVVKHSGASRAFVRVTGEEGQLRLQIADPGRGFDVTETARAGIGLVSMRERVSFIGGDIAVHSAPGRGTRIGVRVGLPKLHSSGQPQGATLRWSAERRPL